MTDKKKFATILETETLKKISEIAAAMRWNKNIVIEVAVEALHEKTFKGEVLTAEETVDDLVERML